MKTKNIKNEKEAKKTMLSEQQKLNNLFLVLLTIAIAVLVMFSTLLDVRQHQPAPKFGEQTILGVGTNCVSTRQYPLDLKIGEELTNVKCFK